MRLIVGVLLLGLTMFCLGCHRPIDPEEAKKAAATFGNVGLLPPQPSEEDPTVILRQQRDRPDAEAEERAAAELQPPATSDPAVLAFFYHQRGIAAAGVGRTRQRLDDLQRAVQFSGQVRQPGWDHGRFVLDLARAELHDKRRRDAARRLEEFVASNPPQRGHLITVAYFLVSAYTDEGYLERAETALQRGLRVWRESFNWNSPAVAITARGAQMQLAQGQVLMLKGQFAAAVSAYREAVATMAGDPIAAARDDLAEVARSALAGALARQGSLVEAEIEARRALAGTLRKRGGATTLAIDMTVGVTGILLAQGRYEEAEALARAAQQNVGRIGTGSLAARNMLLRTLAAQERWDDAISEYDALQGRSFSSAAFRLRFFSSPEMLITLLVKDRAAEAEAVLKVVVDDERQRLGPLHPVTVVHRALLAIAIAARGDRQAALTEFRQLTPILLDRSLDIDDDTTTRALADRHREFIVGRYIGLLAEVADREPTAAVEAFRLAEAVRGRSVARAIDASAARNAASIPALAALVRRSQDARKQVETLYGRTVNILSARAEDQDAEQVRRLRAQIDALQQERQALDEQIVKRYPGYAQLINPAPGTVAEVQRVLKPGEALISTLVTHDRTFVWAIPQRGPVAFAAPPLDADAARTIVARLRKALDPGVTILGDIPAFETDVAHDLYLALLEPVRAGWERAHTLLIVPHGALGQLPFALLPTSLTPAPPPVEPGALFSAYRSVPWLARKYATVVLPSAGALTTLRSAGRPQGSRRPFIGFGDPYFTAAQARQATTTVVESAAGVLMRRLKRDGAGASLADLPPLPDTADEIRAIASSLGADPVRDVILGQRANERTVMSARLSDYRVIAFATHGLVPGDLAGLTQPALALTAPEVAGIEGDGLLTMEKILGLRLNADWIVLSACNTANGRGAGSEAISGLGQAFFYAGARALLVTSWPVETTSARALTTDLFRRQEAMPTLTRARALQETMLSVMDGPGFVDPRSGRVVFTYAHPIFWAPFQLVGDGG